MPTRGQRRVSSTAQDTLVVTPVRGDVPKNAGLDHSVGSVLTFRHFIVRVRGLRFGRNVLCAEKVRPKALPLVEGQLLSSSLSRFLLRVTGNR